jgi:hypothetical protein
MKWGRAFWSGVIAGAVMTILMAFARASGMPVNMSLMLGTLTGLAPSPGAGLIAFSYAWGFETVSHRANAGIGTLFAAMHVVLAGFFLGVIPAIHPFMPTQINPPGIFLANLGVAGIVAFVALHLLYGVIVGGMYGPIRHAHRAAARGERPVAAH